MKFEDLEIKLRAYNDIFSENGEIEVARILREIASKIERGEMPTSANDLNGSKCAYISYDGE